MKTLVTYYSRSGNTKKIAEKIARQIKADTDEIIDLKDRSRKIIGWFVAGKDASMKKPTKIKYKKSPDKYDLIIIGTPVWAWTMTPAIRTYLNENGDKLKTKAKKLAFFCTCGGQKGKAFEEMESLSKKPRATLTIKDRDIKCSDDEIKSFCREIK
jgi:flavodoxin